MVFSTFSVAVIVCLLFGEPLVKSTLEADTTSVQQRRPRQDTKKPKYACPWGKINDCQWTDGNDNHPGSETFCFSHCNLQHLSPSCKNSCTCSCRDLTCIGRQINDPNMRDFCMKIVIQEGRVTVNNKNACDCSMMSCTNKQSCVDVKL